VEASWPIMTPKPDGISEAEYRELRRRFNPTKFDPYHFVDLARGAGQQYMVFTTKHHDGFCTFDTSYADCKITNLQMLNRNDVHRNRNTSQYVKSSSSLRKKSSIFNQLANYAIWRYAK
jgi:hypothetical protein